MLIAHQLDPFWDRTAGRSLLICHANHELEFGERREEGRESSWLEGTFIAEENFMRSTAVHSMGRNFHLE